MPDRFSVDDFVDEERSESGIVFTGLNESSGRNKIKVLSLLNPFQLIATVLSWLVSTLLNIVDVVKMTFHLLGKTIGYLFKDLFIKIVIVIGISVVNEILYNMYRYDDVKIPFTIFVIIVAAFGIKIVFHDIPRMLWGAAMTSIISNKKIVLYSSCLFVGIIITALPLFVFTIPKGFHIYYWGCIVYGIYTGSFYKILRRM